MATMGITIPPVMRDILADMDTDGANGVIDAKWVCAMHGHVDALHKAMADTALDDLDAAQFDGLWNGNDEMDPRDKYLLKAFEFFLRPAVCTYKKGNRANKQKSEAAKAAAERRREEKSDGEPKKQTQTKKKKSAESPELAAQMQEAMDYYNRVCGRNRTLTETSRKSLSRILHKYSIEDVKAVIKLKYNDWQDDDKMSKYLVPDTIFRPSNFDRYVQDAREVSATAPIPISGNQAPIDINWYEGVV